MKLLSAKTVADSPQLRPHVEFLLTRVATAQAKLQGIVDSHPNVSQASPAPPPVVTTPQQQQQQQGEQQPPEKVPSPLKEEPKNNMEQPLQQPQSQRSPTRVAVDESIAKLDAEISASIAARPAVGSPEPIETPSSPSGASSSVPQEDPVTPVSINSRSSTVATTSTSPRSQRKSVKDFDMLVGRVRRESMSPDTRPALPPAPSAAISPRPLVSPRPGEEITASGSVILPQGPPPPLPARPSTALETSASTVLTTSSGLASSDDKDWKTEYEKMNGKFEAAKNLIMKLQEKVRRVEASAALVPPLQKKVGKLEKKLERNAAVNVHLEEKIPLLNARIVELEIENAKLKEELMLGQGTPSNETVVFQTGERCWAKGVDNDFWYEATVQSLEPSGEYFVRFESSAGPYKGLSKMVGGSSIRKMTVQVAGIDPVLTDDDDDTSEMDPAAATTPIAPIPVSSIPSSGVSPSPAGADKSGGDRTRTMDQLLGSAKQNVKSLFTRRRDTVTVSTKAQEKLRSLFKATPDRQSKASLGLEEMVEEVPADAVALADVQRIYSSDLWAALMDPQSSEALHEVYFTTYEYHSTWEQVLGTLTSIYNESKGTEAEALERRAQVLKLIRTWIRLCPELLKAKATVGDHLKGISFADPASLTGGNNDSETLQARGKFIVGDYGTNQVSTTKIREMANTALTSTPSNKNLTTSASSISPLGVNPTRQARATSRADKPSTATPGGANTTTQTLKTPSKSVGSVSPRQRPKTQQISPNTSPRMDHISSIPSSSMTSMSKVSIPSSSGEHSMDAESSKADDDDSDFSDDGDDITFDEGDDNDARTRKKGRHLFKSIGQMYKSLNMDVQSLQHAFQRWDSDGSGAAPPSTSEDVDDSGNASSSLDHAARQGVSFLEALRKWVDVAAVMEDKQNVELEKFEEGMSLWRRGPSRRKSKSVVAKKLVRQEHTLKKGLLLSVKEMAATDLFQFSPFQVAKQLFLEEWELFAAIKSSELHCLRFMDAKSGHGFQYMVYRFNTWCSWIATEVLNRNTSVARAAAIEFFIEVAAECNKLHNFNSAYAIIGGLNQPGVARLKYSWERVSKKAMRTYNKVLAFWSTSQNMSAYRAELKKVKPPAVPYLGLVGKDLFQIETGTPTVLSLKTDEEWVLNFHKLRSLAQQFRFITKLQESEQPDWEPNMDIATCISAVKPLSENEAYERSLKLEPRNITAQELYILEHGSHSTGATSITASGDDVVRLSRVSAGEHSTEESAEKSSGGGGGGVGGGGGSAASSSSTGATSSNSNNSAAAVPKLKLNGPIKSDIKAYKLGSPDLDTFLKSGVDAQGSLELLACVANAMLKAPEFAPPQGSKNKVCFSVAAGVTWLVRELGLLEASHKYDMDAAETAKGNAVKIVEGLRGLGLIAPAKKWAAKLVGTLRNGGFQGFAMKADDQSVWVVDSEEMERQGLLLTE